MPIPLGSFRDSLDGLDPEERAAFVAAVYEARGWAVERVGRDERADVVVTPPNGDESRHVPVSVDADILHEQVTYAVDDEARTRLCRRFFGQPPAAFAAADEDDTGGDGDADSGAQHAATDGRTQSPPARRTESESRTTGRVPSDTATRAVAPDGATDGNPAGTADGDDARPSVPVRLVVGLVAVAVVGAAVVAGAGVTSPETAGVSLGEGANATTTPEAPVEGGAAAAGNDETPPGIDGDGVADASALADAHAEALAERSYRIRIVHREYDGDELRGVAVERVAVAETDHYHSRVRTLGSLEYQTRHVAAVSAYANGTVRYVRPVDGRDTLRNATFRLFMVSDTSTPNRYVDRTRRYVQWFLDVEESRVVGAGERVPVDGTVIEGTAAIDESLVTGESVPVRRERGDEVIGGGLVTEGGVVVEADDGATSTLDRLMAHLWRVRSSRSGVQRLADRLAAVFVPVVVVLALGAFVVHLALGAAPTAAFLTGLTVLVVSCPCALGLATPLAVAAGVREALDAGIVVTDGDVFERATDADIVAFDKTGTLTTGEMTLHDAVGSETAIARAAAVETFADHPMGRAVAEAVDAGEASETPRDAGGTGIAVDDFERHPGRGVSGVVGAASATSRDDADGSDRVTVGRADLFEDCEIPDAYRERYDRAVDAGRIPAYVGWDGAVRGVLVAGDQPRPEWERVVSAVAADVARVVVLTGDGEAAAARFRDHPDVDDVFAGVPPEAKAEVIERLREDGTTVMVGDGSNDAPALAAADLGISLESGTRLAADAADAVVTTGDLTTVPEVFSLTAATKRRIRENLGWAFLYNALAVPAAALGVLNPLVAAVAMAASSLLVVGNSTRGLGGERADGVVGDDVDPAPEPTSAPSVTPTE